MTILFRCLLLFSITSILLQSCSSSDITRKVTKEEAVRLLSFDDEKQWQRVAQSINGEASTFSECEENNMLSFMVSSSDSTLYFIGELPGCSTSDNVPDTLLTATWSLTQDINFISTDTLLLTAQDESNLFPIVIRDLTPRRLQIQFIDSEDNLFLENYIY
ncbi:MAG: hypothetical protein JXQ96_18120 [Cyclobacteriaceae bacterium]